MAKVIIAIHGLGNKPPKEQLERWWKQSMTEGLKAVNKQIVPLKFEFIYWADIMYEKPLNENIKDKNDALFLDEPYTPTPEGFVPEPHPVRKKVLDFIEEQLDRLTLNEDLTVNFSEITDMIIHNYFRDLEIYYSDQCIDIKNSTIQARETIRKRLVKALKDHQDDQIMLIAHSMGTIIALDVLLYAAPEVEIDTFITIGSPLGMPSIIGKIASTAANRVWSEGKLNTPPGIKWRWYNFSDLEDKVALIYNLGNKFKRNANRVRPEDYIVHNSYAMNGNKNHHKSFGYLRTPELSRVIFRFARRKKIGRAHRIILNIKSILRRLKNWIKY